MADADGYPFDPGPVSSVYPDPEHAAQLPWSIVAPDLIFSQSANPLKDIEPFEEGLQPNFQTSQERSDDDDVFYPKSSSDDIAEYYLNTLRPLSSFDSNVTLVSTSFQETNQIFPRL